MKIVVDTNVLVSALWTTSNNHIKILDMIGRGELRLCYDYRILAEYEEVLRRPKFEFAERDIKGLMSRIKSKGVSIIADPLPFAMLDEKDRPFYEVAVHCGAYIITGNIKHFPDEPFIMGSAEFLKVLGG